MESKTYTFVQEIPVEDGYDVVVAGGGPAGTAAAICAARLGARVALVEATGCMGGMGTAGLVTLFFPLADGVHPIVGGFMRELAEALHARGFLADGADPESWRTGGSGVSFKVEGLKLLLDEFALDAGVEVRYFTRVIGVDADAGAKTVHGVIISNVEWQRYLAAKTFIDATGDAALVELCGAPYRLAGRDSPGIMPHTLCAQVTGVDWSRFRADAQQEAVERAIDEGFLSQPDRHLPGLFRISEHVALMNAGHVFKKSAVDSRDLSASMAHGRRLVQEYLAFYRKYVPGCEDIQLVISAELLGVRESRRIVGEYELNVEDFFDRREFPDQIGLYKSPIDVHPYDATEEEYRRYYNDFQRIGRLGKGEHFGLPYGILVPKGWRNLWAAGRCVSTDIRMNGAIRMQPCCAMLGQAAGTAAVQSARTGQPACDLDTAQLVETLRAAGAYLPQSKLTHQMTRA